MSYRNHARLPHMLSPAGNPGWFKINNRAAEENPAPVADVYIYAEIGASWFDEGSVSANDFVKQVAGLDVEKINLHLNSPGGDVFDGIAIANVIRQHKAETTVYVDGLAASAASFIAMAGKEVVMSANAELMIHDAWGACIGDSTDMIDMARRLDHTSNNIASMYAAKAGGSVEVWREQMQAETWYSADEAVQAGLADRVAATEDKVPMTGTAARFDLSIFNHAGRAKAPPPPLPLRMINNGGTVTGNTANVVVHSGEYLVPASTVRTFSSAIPHTSPAGPVRNPNPTTEGADTMSDTLTSGLRERLGIADDAELDDDGLLAALDEALAPQSENHAPELPSGTVMIEQTILDELRASADLGRQAREQQLAAQRNALVDAAVADGRIAPSRRDHWIASLVADPGAAEVLNSLAKGTVPLQASGYTGGPDEHSDDDAYPANWKL